MDDDMTDHTRFNADKLIAGSLPLVSPESFRQAMSEVTAAVHVITTTGSAGRSGLTASAVTSLSAEPPLMLACIHADSRTLAALEAAGIFCINTLSGEDQEVAETFAGRKGLGGEARFAAGDWATLKTGAPVLKTALTAFDCRLIEVRTHATHRVIIGEVVAIGGRGTGDGLIYRNRRFGTF
jgi:flavin reductase